MRLILNGILGILFPDICSFCSSPLADGENQLCDFCKKNKFELTDTKLGIPRCEIMPDFIAFRTSVWEFDQNAPLQNLMHQLKYEQAYGLGIDFGKELGKQLRYITGSEGWLFCYQPFLVPVPLHQKKQRIRGFNQSRAICDGIQQVTGWSIIHEKKVSRPKKTETQTGLSSTRRKINLSGAFSVQGLDISSYEMPIIVDDVYTTGATTMELASTLKQAGAERIGIATVAEA